MNTMASSIYVGRIMHHRMAPRHRFSYRAFSMLLDIDELPELDHGSRLFGYNRPALMAFHDHDHGPGDGSSLRMWAEGHLRSAGMDVIGGSIRILCLPRMFGYAFNPISVWFCHQLNGELAAVIYEVRNTFGERRSYLIPADSTASEDRVFRHSCAKAFHVSPFLPVEGNYHFRLTVPGDDLMLQIQHVMDGKPRLVAIQSGKRAPFSSKELIRILLRFPLMTVKVFTAIRFEAVRLWLKRVPVHDHVPATTPEVLGQSGRSS